MKRKRNIAKAVVLTVGVIFVFVCFLSGSTIGSATVRRLGGERRGPGEIYATHCAGCHGSNGKAKTAKGKRTGATDFTSDWNKDQARGIRIITNGKSEMPAFKGKLSAAEIRSVFGYVLRF